MYDVASDFDLADCDAEIIMKTDENESVSLGANRVFLVRDEAAKIKLRGKKVGKCALIFTILESKGMEFEDVILWNFFTDCPCPDEVRHLKKVLTAGNVEFQARKHMVRTLPPLLQERSNVVIKLLIA